MPEGDETYFGRFYMGKLSQDALSGLDPTLPATVSPTPAEAKREDTHQQVERAIFHLSDLEGKVPSSVNTLILTPPDRPMVALNLGNQTDFIRMVGHIHGVRGVIWSESDGITLILEDRHSIVQFRPTIHPYAALFFEKRDKRTNDDDEMRVWEGEFEPVQFTKQNLIKFLQLVEIDGVPKEVVAAIRNMKVSEKTTQEDTISLEDPGITKMVIEESTHTNIPRRFGLIIPITDDYKGHFEFEATVQKKKDRYGKEDALKKVIVLRCLNPRAVLRNCMEQILAQLPPEIPCFYGKMLVGGDPGRR